MSPEFLHLLRARSPEIQRQWETLLRIEPVSGPLANPEALKYLIPEAIDEVFDTLTRPTRAPVSLQVAKACVPECPCGNNPYRAFYVAGERCLLEAVVLQQTQSAAADRRHTDVAEVAYAVRRLARRDIDTFCGACSQRGSAPLCRHAPVAVS